MSDRELLELAAKAAGLNYDHRYGIVFGEDDCGNATEDGWNPLLDDGDALRLAVKLGLCVKVDNRSGHSWVKKIEGGQPHGSDPYAATRRAITRAAAEIGRQMEVTK